MEKFFLNAADQTYSINCSESEVMGNKVRIRHHDNSAARLMLAEISVTGYKRIGKSQIYVVVLFFLSWFFSLVLVSP